MADNDPELTVTHPSWVMPVNLDADGTPLIAGDRCVEIRPGVWMHPDAVAIQAFIEAALPDG